MLLMELCIITIILTNSHVHIEDIEDQHKLINVVIDDSIVGADRCMEKSHTSFTNVQSFF